MTELDDQELALLRESNLASNNSADVRLVEVTVTACAYSCCGRGWRRRDGYEQVYRGWVDNLKEDEPGTFMLYSPGLGTISYVIAARLADVQLVEPFSL